MLVNNVALTLSGTDMSAASITSNAINMSKVINIAIQVVFTGSPVGEWKLQGTCDPQSGLGNQISVTNWTDIANSAQSISAAGNVGWNLSMQGWSAIRVVYTKTSGTGTVTVARMNSQGE